MKLNKYGAKDQNPQIVNQLLAPMKEYRKCNT